MFGLDSISLIAKGSGLQSQCLHPFNIIRSHRTLQLSLRYTGSRENAFFQCPDMGGKIPLPCAVVSKGVQEWDWVHKGCKSESFPGEVIPSRLGRSREIKEPEAVWNCTVAIALNLDGKAWDTSGNRGCACALGPSCPVLILSWQYGMKWHDEINSFIWEKISSMARNGIKSTNLCHHPLPGSLGVHTHCHRPTVLMWILEKYWWTRNTKRLVKLLIYLTLCVWVFYSHAYLHTTFVLYTSRSQKTDSWNWNCGWLWTTMYAGNWIWAVWMNSEGS